MGGIVGRIVGRVVGNVVGNIVGRVVGKIVVRVVVMNCQDILSGKYVGVKCPREIFFGRGVPLWEISSFLLSNICQRLPTMPTINRQSQNKDKQRKKARRKKAVKIDGLFVFHVEPS